MKTVYIAGPMTGIEDFNFPAFYKAAKEWEAAGWTVINPADSCGGYTAGSWGFYLEVARTSLTNGAHAIALLDGWEDSDGAVCEKALAQKYSLEIYLAKDIQTLHRDNQEEEPNG